MSAYKLGIVGFAMMGVWFVVMGIGLIPPALTQADSPGLLVGLGLPPLVFIVAGLFLARNREGLSRWVVGSDDATPDESRHGILPMAYAFLGVWMIANGLATGSGNVWYSYSTPDEWFVSGLIENVVILAFGTVLFFKSQAVARFWSDRQRRTARDDVRETQERSDDLG